MFESYVRYEYWLASSQLILAMLGMGALLAPRDFVEIARTPRALFLGLALQLVAVPALAAMLGATLPISAGIAAGLVLVAAVPGGTVSNVVTYLGRGNIALSISLTGLMTLGALFSTPALLRLLLGAHLPPDFEMPMSRIALEIGMTLLLPLGCGMVLGAWLPSWRDLFSRWCIRGSVGVILMMAIGAAGSGRLDATAYGVAGPFAIFMLCIGAQLIAVLASRAAQLAGPDRLAIAIEVTVRNTNLALLVKASLFPAAASPPGSLGDGMFFVALLYGGVALLVAAPSIWLSRRAH